MDLTDYIVLAAKFNIPHVACVGIGESVFGAPEWQLHSSNLNALVSLVIDAPAMELWNTRALLSCTPNIEYLELGLSFRDDALMSSIFTLCPKITHIHLDYDLARPDDDIYPRDYLQFPTKEASGGDQEVYPGLRYYWNGISPFDQAEYNMLLRYQSTLELVRVGQCDPSSFRPDWETFTACFLPNTTLKHLVLPLYHQHLGSHTQYEDGYACWLNACQGLEHLELRSIWYTLGASMMHTLEHQLPSLRRIDVTFPAFSPNVTDNPWSGKGGGLFLNQLQLLRALRYRCKHTDTFKELHVGFHGRHNMCDMATILSMVTTIRSLEKLTIEGIDYYVSDDEPDIACHVKRNRRVVDRGSSITTAAALSGSRNSQKGRVSGHTRTHTHHISLSWNSCQASSLSAKQHLIYNIYHLLYALSCTKITIHFSIRMSRFSPGLSRSLLFLSTRSQE